MTRGRPASACTRVFTISPLRTTSDSRVISSLASMFSAPSLVSMFLRNVTMLRPYIWLAWSGTVAGRLTGPIMITPFSTMVSPAWVTSQLPPRSAARSTMTEPATHPVHHFARHQDGRFSPGNRGGGDHHVLFLQDRGHLFALAADFLLGQRAGVAALRLRRSAPMVMLTNFAPRLSICSFTAERTS